MFAIKNLTRRPRTEHVGKIRSPLPLPSPAYDSEFSVEQALLKRRSERDYKDEPLQLRQISQLLWAAQGLTGEDNKRTAPSAGALHPLKIYLIASKVEGLSPGIYQYEPMDHSLMKIKDGDKRKQLSAAALMQGAVRHAQANLVLAADYRLTTSKYFERGKTYVHMEAGHAAQNVFLQAVSLHLGTVTMGAFLDGPVKKILHLPAHEEPLYIMPVGKI